MPNQNRFTLWLYVDLRRLNCYCSAKPAQSKDSAAAMECVITVLQSVICIIVSMPVEDAYLLSSWQLEKICFTANQTLMCQVFLIPLL